MKNPRIIFISVLDRKAEVGWCVMNLIFHGKAFLEFLFIYLIFFYSRSVIVLRLPLCFPLQRCTASWTHWATAPAPPWPTIWTSSSWRASWRVLWWAKLYFCTTLNFQKSRYCCFHVIFPRQVHGRWRSTVAWRFQGWDLSYNLNSRLFSTWSFSMSYRSSRTSVLY